MVETQSQSTKSKQRKERNENSRRVVCQVEEKRYTIERSILFEILSEESSSLHIDSHSSENDREIVFVSIVNTLCWCTFRVALSGLLVDETSLTTDLSGDLREGKPSVSIKVIREGEFLIDFVVRKTGSREDGYLLTTSDRVHGIDG